MLRFLPSLCFNPLLLSGALCVFETLVLKNRYVFGHSYIVEKFCHRSPLACRETCRMWSGFKQRTRLSDACLPEQEQRSCPASWQAAEPPSLYTSEVGAWLHWNAGQRGLTEARVGAHRAPAAWSRLLSTAGSARFPAPTPSSGQAAAGRSYRFSWLGHVGRK